MQGLVRLAVTMRFYVTDTLPIAVFRRERRLSITRETLIQSQSQILQEFFIHSFVITFLK